MAVAPHPIAHIPEILAANHPKRKRWTRAELEALRTQGLLDLDAFELIDGDLISTMGKKRPHSICVATTFRRLQDVFPVENLHTETPIDVSPGANELNEPEPDVIVLKKPVSDYLENPRPDDIHLLIEVADTTLAFDLRVKAALYARAGIADYWVLDVNERRAIVHRRPVDGAYASLEVFAGDDQVAPLARPDHPLTVSELFR